MSPAARVVAVLTARGETVAVAESLTGGLVAASLTAVPGASVVVRGGVVAYATEVKASVLGVDPARLERTGPVDAEVAREMARGVARLLGADWGLATTGVAGPGPADGHPAGTVHVAVARRGRAGREDRWELTDRVLRLDGDREAVREGTVTALLLDLHRQLDLDDPSRAGDLLA
ncbi:nicotinamide-nucleotide amidase [Kytococcus aerolatus]|uniref:Nicotinamide-nucleotide amidase n=1 Tax=Kytococcus aerolatus TaxID=592308 RepID=A0A212T5X4_9MICO|nr:nicotinamide-nucleotide amidohydrolase family protein [Kytococcus aerolatus]SNC61438.1 nicotinamide-nucleotide amidase [Kytococcus aerolatus]